jgi:hypothetical protein
MENLQQVEVTQKERNKIFSFFSKVKQIPSVHQAYLELKR